ncbi:MAG: hypothetical protein E7085_10175, partial [Parabacteroides distasonis]|nr:hypothetical protein [Parabacteroides distasonis]
MNKKFSTLLASFLLAGGLFSSANAIDLTKAVSGTYYDLKKTAEFKGTWKSVDSKELISGIQIKCDGTKVQLLKDDAVLTYELDGVDYKWFTVGYIKKGSVFTGTEKAKSDANKLSFTTGDAQYFLASISEDGTLGFKKNDGTNEFIAVDASVVTDQQLSVAELNYFEEDGFSVAINGYKANGKPTLSLAGNPFTGHLTPMVWNKTEKAFETAKENDSFYLKNAAGNYIVAVKYDGEGGNSTESLYGFTTVSEKVLTHDLTRAADASLKDAQEYFGEFQAFADGLEYDAFPELTYLTNMTVNVADINSKANWYELGRYDFGGNATLVASKNQTSNGTELKPIYIKLGGGQVVDWTTFLKAGKFYTVEKLNKNKVWEKLGTDCGNKYAWVSSYGNVLEGQWALTYDGRAYYFTNRENTEISFTLTASTLYYGDVADQYTQGSDTYRIKTVATHAATDGYTTLDITETSTFNIAYASGVYGNAWFTENHDGTSNHAIGLDIDKENALTFTAKEHARARAEKENTNIHKSEYFATDTIYVISTMGYYDEELAEKNGYGYNMVYDTLKVLSYTFTNQYGEVLKYGANMYTSATPKKLEAEYNYKDAKTYSVLETYNDAQNFALRNDNGKLNLVPVSINKEIIYTEGDAVKALHQVFDYNYNKWVKVYAGDAANGLLDNVCLYDRTENDLFVVEATEAPKYRRLVNAIDTISIYRDENASQLLYEEGKFLGLQNENQFEIAPAMLADTAYVRNETYRPMYLLAVGATIVPEGKYCPEHGVDAGCKDEHLEEVAGWVEGRYLVCLADSAAAWAKANPSKHAQANPYMYDGKYKLGFVQATHRNDSLIIASSEKQIFLGDGEFNPATFAFKYVDEEAGSFKIQTDHGFIKWMNGNVISAPEVEADVFNMNEEEDRTPTANEEIAAECVTVIAGNGNVTIAGAAGKKVVIANILGQTVANTVLTSDNAT